MKHIYPKHIILFCLWALTGLFSLLEAQNPYSGSSPYCGETGTLVINELSQGQGGLQEFFELVVVGAPGNPTAPVDLTGWIVDDNNVAQGGQGTATGYVYFGSCFNAVPPGSIIVLYNPDQPNNSLPPDDPTDTNNDGVYVLAYNDPCMESCSSNPSTGSNNETYCPCENEGLPFSNNLGLNNNGDLGQVRNGCELLLHALTYGGVNTTTEVGNSPVTLQTPYGSQGSMTITFMNTVSDDWVDIVNFSNLPAGAESPGAANSLNNQAWIDDVTAGNFTCNGTIADCMGTDAGDILPPAGNPSFPITICEGEDLGVFSEDYSQPDEFPPSNSAFNFEYGWILVEQPGGNIINVSGTGDFDWSVLMPGQFMVYGISYLNVNGSQPVLSFLMDPCFSNIQDIYNYESCGFICGYEIDLGYESPNGDSAIVNIVSSPVPNQPNWGVICELEAGSVDLTQYNNQIDDGQGFNITWYDGDPGGSGNPIGNPGSVDLTMINDLWILYGTPPCATNFDIEDPVLTPSPLFTFPTDTTLCGSYTLPVIQGSNLSGDEAYYTNPMGGGIQYTSGDIISTSQTLYIHGTNNSCPGESSFTVTLTPAPAINPLPDITVCDEYILPAITGQNLSGNEAYYTGSGGSGSMYAAGEIVNTSGTYYIFDSNGNCSDEQNFSLTVENTPVITDPGPLTGCGSLTLPPINVTNGSGQAAYYTTPGGTGTMYMAGDLISSSTTLYIYDANGPCFDEVQITITIESPVPPVFSFDDIYCLNETPPLLPIISDNGIFGSWNPASINTSNPGATNYTFTPDPTECSTVFDTMIIVVDSVTPVFNINTIYCVGDTPDPLPPVSGNSVSGSWSPSSISTATAGTFNYTFTPDGSTPCAAELILSITVNQCNCPNPPTAEAGPDTSVCEDEVLLLNGVIGGPANTGTWSTSGDGIFSGINDLTGTYTPGPLDISAGSVVITLTTDDPDGAGPCLPAADNFILVINAIGEPEFDLEIEYCEGDPPFTLPDSSKNSISGMWNPPVISTDSAGTHTYTFTPDPGQCASTTDTTVTILPTAIPAFSLVDTYCVNDTPPSLPPVSENGIAGNWMPASINTSASGMASYIFTPDSTTPCTEIFTLSVVIIPCGCTTPPTADAGPDTSSCAVDSVQLGGMIGGSATAASWSSSGDGMFSDSSSLNTIYTPGVMDIANGFTVLSLTTDDPDSTGPCAPATDALVLTIDSISSPFFDIDTQYCINEIPDILPDSGIFNITGTWSPGAITTNSIGVTSYTFTPDPGQCAEPYTTDIIVQDSLIPLFSLDTSYCAGESPPALPGTSENGIGGLWIPSQINTDSTGTTLYTFLPDSSEICAGPFTLEINVEDCGCANPATADAGSDTTICAGENIILEGNIGGSASSGIWSSNGDGSFSDSLNLNSFYFPGAGDISMGTVVLTLTTNDPDSTGPCFAAVSSVIINIEARVTPLFSFDTVICVNSIPPALPQVSINNINGSWSPDTINTSVAGTSVYTFTPNSGSCNTAISVTIDVRNTLDPIFNLPDSLCVGAFPSALTETSVNGISGSWSPDSIETSFAGTITYTFTPDDTLCSTPYLHDVTVSDCDCVNPAFVYAGEDTLLCGLDTVRLSGSISGGATSASWFSNGDGKFIDSLSLIAMYMPGDNDLDAGSVTLSLITNDPDGAGPCVPAIDVVTIFLEEPVLPMFSFQTSYCEQDAPATLPLASDNGIAGQWEPAEISIDSVGVEPYTFFPNRDECAPAIIYEVEVNPGVDVTLDLPDSLCLDTLPYALPITSLEGIAGTWIKGTVDSSDYGYNPFIFIPDVPDTCVNLYYHYIEVYNCNCVPVFNTIRDTLCAGEVTVINGKEYSVSNPTGSDTIVAVSFFGCDSINLIELTFHELMIDYEIDRIRCDDSATTLQIYALSDHINSFSIDGGNIQNIQNLPFSILLDLGQHNLMLISEFGCDTVIDITIEPAIPEGSLDIGPDREVDIEKPVSVAINSDFTPMNIIWDPFSCPGCEINMFTPDSTIVLTVKAEDQYGCIYHDTVLIRVVVDKYRNIYIPNGFTPNGDDINDEFRIFNAEGYQAEVQIFNRFGDMVFHSGEVSDASAVFWNGKFKGEVLNPAVFVYQITLTHPDGSTRFFQGDLTLVR